MIALCVSDEIHSQIHKYVKCVAKRMSNKKLSKERLDYKGGFILLLQLHPMFGWERLRSHSSIN